MKNPWTKKNPFMSLWLSGANSIAGSARGRAVAAGKRQASTMVTQSANEVVRFWTGALSAPTPKKKKRR